MGDSRQVVFEDAGWNDQRLKLPLKNRTGSTPWLRTSSMPVSMTGKIEHVEVITSVQRRRRRSAEGKAVIVQETYAPGMSVSLTARRHDLAAALSQRRTVGGRRRRGSCSRLRIPGFAASGSRAAAAVGQEDVGEGDPARGAGSGAAKKAVARALAGAGRHAVKTIADTARTLAGGPPKPASDPIAPAAPPSSLRGTSQPS